MLQISLAQVRANAARLVATVLAIVIAVGFIVATLVLDSTSRATVYQAVAAQYTSVDAVAELNWDVAGPNAPDDRIGLAALAAVRKLPGVARADLERSAGVEVSLPGKTGRAFADVQAVADDPTLRWENVLSGRLPDRPGEIAVANQVDVPLGEDLSIVSTRTDAEGNVTERNLSSARVVGVVDQRGDPRAEGVYRLFATGEDVGRWGSSGASTIRIDGDGSISPQRLADDVRHGLPRQGFPGTLAWTGADKADDAARVYTGDAAAITTVLLCFAAVAVLVSALVIANTFAVLLAQRTRELALLRAVGATGRQVRRGVLVESAVIGLLASLLGVAGGVAVAAGLVQVGQRVDSPIPVEGLSVPWTAGAIGIGIGVAMTVLAALLPAFRATRVSPLAAMRPVEDAPVRSRAGLARLGLGLLIGVPGALLLAQGALDGDLYHGVAGGAATFLGVLLLSRKAVPFVVALVGRVTGRFGGVPGEMASLNAVRNPQRTAATATALLIGVTLTTTMVVGVASVRASGGAILDNTFDTDVVIDSSTTGLAPDEVEALPDDLAGQVSAVDGVAAVLPVLSASVDGLRNGGTWPVQGIDTGRAASVARSETDLPRPGEIVLARNDTVPDRRHVDGSRPADQMQGARIELSSGPRSIVLTVRVDSGDRFPPARMALSDLLRLVPDAKVTSMWVRLDDEAAKTPLDAVTQITDVAGATESGPLASGVVVSGPAQERSAYDRLLDVMLLIVTALLAVAVLIAVIGVGNTIALSVIERRQETGLLRALGLTRRQLRGMLLWEAALVAGVASLLGVALGVVYGLSGTSSVLARQGDVILSVPWGQVAVIVVVATLAGAAASVLPSRRAARTSPVEAMAI